MKLSKQERIAAIVVIVLIVIVAGVFMFIKPNIETIIATKNTLTTKENEFKAAEEKAATKDDLKKQVLDAYNEGKNMADMFFPEMTSYELDNEFRTFLQKVKDNGKANVLVEDMRVSEPGTVGLSTTVYGKSSVQYALKDYVNQGKTPEVDNNLARQVLIQAALGDPQTIGASTVSFTAKTITQEDMLAFVDEINNYMKEENGKEIRKAISTTSIEFTDPKTKFEYDQLVEKLNKEAGENGVSHYKSDTDKDDLVAIGSDGDAEYEESIADHYFTKNFTITFYCIERMQDPTDQLNAQDVAV